MAAGTSYVNLTLSNGQTLSAYISTSAAIGVIPNVSLIGTAGTTTPQEFQFPTNLCTVDQVNVVGTAGAVSAGQIEVYNITEGKRSNKFFDLETTGKAAAIAQRQVPRVCFKAGHRYRFIVSTAQTSA